MDWCLIWNSVYEGSLASAGHMMFSNFFYILLSASVIYMAWYYGGPGGIELGNEYREIIRHGDLLFSAGHDVQDDDGESSVHTFKEAREWLKEKEHEGALRALQTTAVPHWIQQILDSAKKKAEEEEDEHEDEGDGHKTDDPLLNDEEREILIVPSIAMLIFFGVNILITVGLIFAVLSVFSFQFF